MRQIVFCCEGVFPSFFDALVFQLRHAGMELREEGTASVFAAIGFGSGAFRALSSNAAVVILIAPCADEKTRVLMQQWDKQVLFVHGTHDAVCPPSHSEALSFHARAPKKIVWVQDADHSFSAPYAQYQLLHHIIHFLQEPMCFRM